jgi:hypothetical protein
MENFTLCIALLHFLHVSAEKVKVSNLNCASKNFDETAAARGGHR